MNKVESYVRPDGCECWLTRKGDQWEVTMWDADGNHHWTVARKEGQPFNETLAREEFERWRS